MFCVCIRLRLEFKGFKRTESSKWVCIACDDGRELELRRAIVHEESQMHESYVKARKRQYSLENTDTHQAPTDQPAVRDSDAFIPQYMRQMATLGQLMEGAVGAADGQYSAYHHETEQDTVHIRTDKQNQQEVFNDLLDDWNEFAMDFNADEPAQLSDREMVEQSISQLIARASGVWDEDSESDEEEDRSDTETEDESSEDEMGGIAYDLSAGTGKQQSTSF